MTCKERAARRIPRGPRRREELVLVAEAVFLEHGFTESTMQLIASRAGASKETLYRHFANKETLFAEVISRRASLVSGPESALSREGPPRRVLFELGRGLLRLMTQGEAVPLLRLVIAESPKSPELGVILYENGPGLTLDRLADYLREATLRGELRCRRPTLAAKLFSWRGDRQLPHPQFNRSPGLPVEEAEILAPMFAARSPCSCLGTLPEGRSIKTCDDGEGRRISPF